MVDDLALASEYSKDCRDYKRSRNPYGKRFFGGLG